jgi:preprotein translocase subunit SecY
MSYKAGVSRQTQRNWLVDASLFSSAVVAMLSGIYFLFLPIGGYQGGRNPTYNLTILFSRHTWDDLHTWSGILMMIIVAVHLSLHWQWVVSMTRRMVKDIFGKGASMNSRGRFNLWTNIIVAISFLVTALSGVYFLFFPGGRDASNPQLLFKHQVWDLLHTWGAVILILAAVVHFVIHWNWVVKVSRNLLSRLFYPASQPHASNTFNTTT